MTTEKFPRRLIRRVEGRETFPLIALESLRELRAYLDDVEAGAIHRAREMGASADDIAEAMGITRQGAYYKMKHLPPTAPAADGEATDDIAVTLPEPEESRPNRP